MPDEADRPENEGFGSFRHLAERFVGALDPRGPAPDEEAWALGWLLPGEQQLWHRMSGPDRRHAAGVARQTIRLLSTGGAPPPGRQVVAAALLHDVGKVESGLGTFARVAVTVAAIAGGRERLVAEPPPPGPGQGTGRGVGLAVRRRVRQYLTHDRIGAELLRAAGSDPMTVAWAGEHHLPAGRWSVDRRLANALKAADGD
ncbi:MAG TPA: hypothetical protein VFN68_03890 [Acidimicrobiales bacterium]|nr:hypothetical protein [Acidimicrobiales bacterium]